MPETRRKTQLHFINTSRQKQLLGTALSWGQLLLSSHITKFSLLLGSGQMQQRRAEKLTMHLSHTASIAGA